MDYVTKPAASDVDADADAGHTGVALIQQRSTSGFVSPAISALRHVESSPQPNYSGVTQRDIMLSLEEFDDLRLHLEDIVEATDNFSDENLIGLGGFGRVYKGNLVLFGKSTPIVARRLHYDYGQGDLEFWNEISTLATLKHDNLVSFKGFCYEERKKVIEKIIINEHEVNESLDKHLSSQSLTWMQRLKICVGVAHALSYIHCDDERESSVIHRNIKSSKILLDENWKPKLSGFELSKANTKARKTRPVLAEISGTIGYVDPIYENTGLLSHKSDVYSLGVVLFEVLCGRRAFVPDEQEPHSPKSNEKEDKGGELDVMVIANEIPDPRPRQFTTSTFVPDGQPHHSPEFNEKDGKGGESDVTGKLDEIPDRRLFTVTASVPDVSEQDSSQLTEHDYKERRELDVKCKVDETVDPRVPTEKTLVPDEKGQHSPQSTEQDYKGGKLDVMVMGKHDSKGKPKESLPLDAKELVIKLPSYGTEDFDSTMLRMKEESLQSIGMELKSTGQAPSLESIVRQISYDGPPSWGSLKPTRQLSSNTYGQPPSLPTSTDGPSSSFVRKPPMSYGGPTSYGGTISSFGGPTREFTSYTKEQVPSLPTSFNKPSSSFVAKPPISYGGPSSSFGGRHQKPVSLSQRPLAKPSPPFSVEPTQLPVNVPMPSPANVHPLYTIKRLDQYEHPPKGQLLAKLAKSHYEVKNLEDIIDPALWKQMDPESLRIFSETAYQCLDDTRAKRPNIELIFDKLKESLKAQVASSEVVVASNPWKGKPMERLQIPFEDIKKATNNFSQKFYLGEGAYGKVYSAELELPVEEQATGDPSRNLTTVAIKRITDIQKGRDGFIAEIELLTRCKHTNVISLLGFCDEGPNMILVYEFASNGSLEDYLTNPYNSIHLTWVQRLNFGIDIARGLESLHMRDKPVLHLDIKSGNILLSKNMVAKIADFGLSRSNRQVKSMYTKNAVGTEVYMCPQFNEEGRLTTAIDIYSFGVVLFEILSGKMAYDEVYLAEDTRGIAQVARLRFEDDKIHEMVDKRVMEEVDELTSTLHKGPNQDSLRTYIDIAYQCIAEAQNDRPTAKHILAELENALSYQVQNKDNLQMSFEEIKAATQNFSPDKFIGRGGFGNVYEGILTHGNKISTAIVAKRFHGKKGQGEEHFVMELEILVDYKHKNIIGLEGYCNENGEKIIVYEHAANKSLDGHLSNSHLTWTKRLEICIDIACGLDFLHRGAPTNESVIHRDIKSANILLKGDWKATISDFGLSAITARNGQVNSSYVVGTAGYVDPQFDEAGFFTEKSDIYSLGVVLFEILYGKLLVPTKKYDKKATTKILRQIHGEGNLESIVFKDIKKQIAPKSLSTFRAIVSKCLVKDRKNRPTAEEVLQQLGKSLEFQEDYEKWGPKLPSDYKEIFKTSKYAGTYTTKTKKDLYSLLSKGILLQNDKVWFSLGRKDERNVTISATTFSFRNCSPHDNWCTNVPRSRFEKVAEMLDISNLMIEIETKTKFLSPDTNYGVYLVFRFCDSKNVSKNPLYVDLKYRKGNETLHAYFASWRDDEWMRIELYRFLNQKEEDVGFNFLLESLSPYYCREHDAIYVESIEFRPTDNVGHEETKKSEEIKQVLEPNPKLDQKQIPTKSEMIWKGSINYGYGEELFWVTEIKGKKQLMLSAKAALYNFHDLTLLNLKPSLESRFREVLELLLPQQIFRINCAIKRQMLTQDSEYECYLVFKLSEKCQGLHGPVEVRDLHKQKNKVAAINVYFRTPSPWNIHDHITRLPKQRTDGWMEVTLWRLINSDHEAAAEKDHIPLNFKFTTYQGSMSGLIICGLDFRPI